jgi:predicted metal-binding protein
MVPPFSPPPAESARWLQAFAFGVVFQFERLVSGTYAGLVQGKPGWACGLSAARACADFATDVLPLWRELHDSVMWAERECMRRGYYLSVGLGAGACELCPDCDPSKLCVLPYQARPSIEAVGIDILRTLPHLQWPAGGPAEGGWNLALTGMVLAV